MVATVSLANRQGASSASSSPPSLSPSQGPRPGGPARPHPSRTHFVYKAKSGTHVLQKLAGPSNYARWADNLRVILKAHGLWAAVASPALAAIAESAADGATAARARAQALEVKQAFAFLFLSCTWPMQLKLGRCSDGHDAWRALQDYVEHSRGDPHVARNLGQHRVEYAFGGCHWEMWRLSGKGNWHEWALGIRAVLEAEGLWRGEPGLGRESTEGRRRNGLALALVKVAVEPELRQLLQTENITSVDDALDVLERACTWTPPNRESVVFAGTDAVH